MLAQLTILGPCLLLTICVADTFRPNRYIRCALHGQGKGCKMSVVSHFKKLKNSVYRRNLVKFSDIKFTGNIFFYKVLYFFTFTWPWIVTNFFIIRPNICSNFANLFLAWNSTCFGQCLCPSSGVHSLYTQQWYMSYRVVDSCREGP
jgi:hypothetical protein